MSLLTVTRRRRGTYSRTQTNVRWLAAFDGTAYGVTASNTWATTPDGYAITDTGVTALYGTKPVIDLHVDADGFIVHTAGALDAAGIPSGTGAVWAGAALASMTNVTPTGWTANTCGRNSVVTRNSAGVILVGQYSYVNTNAFVHRSTNGGTAWTYADLGYSGTRHVHAVHFDPWDDAIAWATVGDSPGSPKGLYKSTNSGETWANVAFSEYPIDFGFLDDGTFVGEGDGIDRPHIVTWVDGQGTTFTSAITPATAEAATGQEDWTGTTRALCILGPDRIFYTTTAEEGATGTRWGIWEANRSEGTWTPTLLEELAARWMVMGRTVQVGGVLLSYTYRITLPQ